MKWVKFQAKFNITHTFCWGNYKQSWHKGVSETNQLRVKLIIDLHRQDYNILENYLFRFYFN
ncbi:hypothetical protein BTO06_16030 [Tenacibaculum sp. SZ-18]|nr:hypothetical protein BTO06_16030 [Tenacibaculum sp. SZ-18]